VRVEHKLSELILWSDEHLLVVNKPAGLLTLPDGYDPQLPCLVRLLEAQYGRLWVVHRLDKDTSGILLTARTAQAHRTLNLQFEQREVDKCYHAIVVGEPPWQEMLVDEPLLVDGDRQHRTRLQQLKGKPSRTRLRVLERFGRYTVLQANPETGRRHQIRAHLCALGLPIAADELYGGGKELTLAETEAPGVRNGDGALVVLTRPALHAWSLEMTHPLSGERLHFEAGYPPDFEYCLQMLRVSAAHADSPALQG